MGWLVGKPGAVADARRGKRAEERFSTDLLTSTLGEVVDLSGSGARVRCTGRPDISVGQVLPVTIKSNQCQVTLKSRVVRVQRAGFRTVEIGITFIEIKPGLRAALHHLARFGFIPNLRGGADDSGAAGADSKRHRSALPDYYGLLRIAPVATEDQIRAAYHDAARRYHPDANRSADRVLMFQAVSEAYRILRDPQKRADYDARRAKAATAA